LDKADSKILREVQNFIALRDQSNSHTNGDVIGVTAIAIQPQAVSVELIKVAKKIKK
jgi:hypothetical protein